MSRFKGKVSIVTGGGSGIGFAIAASLAEEGMAVVISGRDDHKLQQAQKRLEKLGRTIKVVKADVSIRHQVESMVAQVMDEYGRIDLLVNNAGIGQRGPIADLSDEEWETVQSTNLKGAFLACRAVLPIMKKQRSGYIVNIASLAGKMGFGGSSAYSASKFGLIGFTESLLEEVVGDNIKATAICPGYVATPMVASAGIPQNEMIPPEDIGRLVLGLLSLSPQTIIKEIVIERRGAIGT